METTIQKIGHSVGQEICERNSPQIDLEFI